MSFVLAVVGKFLPSPVSIKESLSHPLQKKYSPYLEVCTDIVFIKELLWEEEVRTSQLFQNLLFQILNMTFHIVTETRSSKFKNSERKETSLEIFCQ
jgi:hypothetical protein